MGVVSNPRTPIVRRWIRRTYMSAPAAKSDAVLLRFLAGKRGLTAADLRGMREEQRKHGERGGIQMWLLRGSDGIAVGLLCDCYAIAI